MSFSFLLCYYALVLCVFSYDDDFVFCTLSLGDDLFSETSDLGIPNKPLVTNYFVPKSMLKRTTKLVSQIQRWKKVAKDGGTEEIG